MWRSEDWNNPFIKDPDYIPTVTDLQGTKNLMHNTFEAGADAMQLEFLKLMDNEQLVPKRVADDIKIYMGIEYDTSR